MAFTEFSELFWRKHIGNVTNVGIVTNYSMCTENRMQIKTRNHTNNGINLVIILFFDKAFAQNETKIKWIQLFYWKHIT